MLSVLRPRRQHLPKLVRGWGRAIGGSPFEKALAFAFVGVLEQAVSDIAWVAVVGRFEEGSCLTLSVVDCVLPMHSGSEYRRS